MSESGTHGGADRLPSPENAAAGDTLNVSGEGESTVTIGVDGANGDWWSLDFDAPDGEALTPGATASWTATASPSGSTAFVRGKAEVSRVRRLVPRHGHRSSTAVVRLVRA